MKFLLSITLLLLVHSLPAASAKKSSGRVTRTKKTKSVAPKNVVEYSRQVKKKKLPKSISFFEALFTNQLTIGEADITYPDYSDPRIIHRDPLGTALSDNQVDLIMHALLVSEQTIGTLSTDHSIRLLEITAQLQLERFAIVDDNSDNPSEIHCSNRVKLLTALRSSNPKLCLRAKDLPILPEEFLPITTVVKQFLADHPEHNISNS